MAAKIGWGYIKKDLKAKNRPNKKPIRREEKQILSFLLGDCVLLSFL